MLGEIHIRNQEKRRKILRVEQELILFLVQATKDRNEMWRLPIWPDLPEDIVVAGVYYNPDFTTLDFVVYSKDFEEVPEGTACPTIFAERRAAGFPNPFLDDTYNQSACLKLQRILDLVRFGEFERAEPMSVVEIVRRLVGKVRSTEAFRGNLNAELESAERLGLLLVNHLERMRAAEMSVPVEIEGRCFEVKVKRLDPEKSSQ